MFIDRSIIFNIARTCIFDSYPSNLGLDYKLKDIVYQGKRIKLQLW
jgi:hypothetical protein